MPGNFDPPFSYERSVSYPEGHRNCVFAKRGIRSLPRLPLTAEKDEGHAPDTHLLMAAGLLIPVGLFARREVTVTGGRP